MNTMKTKRTTGRGGFYRVREDGRIEVKQPSDRRWGKACVHEDEVFASTKIAARKYKVTASAISKRIESMKDWSWATLAQVAERWPGAVRVYKDEGDNGDNGAAATSPAPTAVPAETGTKRWPGYKETSFMAVKWPDGQVTVRASVGPWLKQFPDAAAVPDGVLESAKVYDLAGA